MKRNTLHLAALASAAMLLSSCATSSNSIVSWKPSEAQNFIASNEEPGNVLLAADVPVAEKPQPPAASQPALPPGHPAIPAPDKTPALPAGHPAIPAPDKMPALPEGHPQIPAGGATTPAPGGLPSGHPDISQMQLKPGSASFGTLSIKASQGTKGGTAPAGDKVTVELYNGGRMVSSATSQLDETGSVVAENVPLMSAVQPLVKVVHAGVEYQAMGETMEPKHSKASVEVLVYETTEQRPDWNVKMRHVMLRPTADGMKVTEMLAVENPGERAWVGAPGAAGEKRVTFELALPAGAQQVHLSAGLHEPTAKVVEKRVINTAPLVPGVTQMQVSYVLPVAEGKTEMVVLAPAATGHIMLFAPDDGSTVTGDGLVSAGTTDMGQGSMRFFTIAPMAAGKALNIALSGIPKAAATPAPAAIPAAVPAPKTDAGPVATPENRPESASSSFPLMVGGGSALVLVGGMVVIFLRPAAKGNETR